MADEVTRSILVKADPATCFALWDNFERFPEFMQNIKEVRKTGPDTSHWAMKGPPGMTVEWNARTTKREENERIAWSSTDGDLTTSGEVTFAEHPDGYTQVTVILKYVPPGGAVGKRIAELLANPERKLEEDLRNFKARVESGVGAMRQ